MKKKIIWATVLALLALRLYLPTLLKNYINTELGKGSVYHGHVDDVAIHLWRGAYTAKDFKLEEVKGQKTFPFIAAQTIDVGLNWKDLFHGAIVAKIKAKDLDINLVREPGQPKNNSSKGSPTDVNFSVQSLFRSFVPINVSTLLVEGGSVHFRDLTTKPQLDIYLNRLSLKAYNLTNSQRVSKSLFGTIELNAFAMERGTLSIVLLLNPLASPPEFKATTILKDFNLTQLNRLFMTYAKFDVERGDFSLYSEMVTAGNNLKGYIKPVIQNLKVADFKEDKKKSLSHAYWEETVGLIASILKNFPKKRQAAIINFDGQLNKPSVSSWDIAKSILRNMFIKPIAPKIDHSVKLGDVKKK